MNEGVFLDPGAGSELVSLFRFPSLTREKKAPERASRGRLMLIYVATYRVIYAVGNFL
jgi:hypothetical protein